jgi:regulator of protease activity HflC (stomatin/prohibitin superfamily)
MMAQSRTGSAALGIVVVIVAIVGLLAIFSIRIVGAGQVGVIHTFGEVDLSPRPSGLLFKLPWASMETMNVRTQQFTMSSASEDVGALAGGTVNTLTSEGLTVGVDLTVLFRLDFVTAPTVFRDLGPQYQSVVLLPAIRGAIRDVVAQYSAEDLYTVARATVGDLILSNLIRDLEARGIVAEQVLLRDITLPPQIRQAIELKLAAEQSIQERAFRVEEAEQEANRRRAEAEGQRDAQALINETLTPEFLQFQYIESLAKMEGGNIIYVPISPGSGLPVFLDAGESPSTTAP